MLWIALSVVTAVCSYAQSPTFRPPEDGLTIFVYDGDTILVNVGGKKIKVRLLGINAPEKEGPYTKNEPLGDEARQRVIELALRKKVTLIYEGDSLKDKYGRYLAHVILPGGRTLNEILLKEGLAKAYRKFKYSRKKRYRKLEAKAKADCLGIWKLLIKRCVAGSLKIQ